jgi:hypothetical protein
LLQIYLRVWKVKSLVFGGVLTLFYITPNPSTTSKHGSSQHGPKLTKITFLGFMIGSLTSCFNFGRNVFLVTRSNQHNSYWSTSSRLFVAELYKEILSGTQFSFYSIQGLRLSLKLNP